MVHNVALTNPCRQPDKQDRFCCPTSHWEVCHNPLHFDDEALSGSAHFDVVLLAVVIGAAELECETVDEVMSCLEQGSVYRHTGTTQMNEQSSRSHTIFTVFIGKLLSNYASFVTGVAIIFID